MSDRVMIFEESSSDEMSFEETSQKEILFESEFKDLFYNVSNSANGNCFFEAMEYLLIETLYPSKHDNMLPTASEIRKMVGDFYKDFDMDIDYPSNTIEYNIKLGIMFDNIDGGEEDPASYNIEDMGIKHIYNVYHDYVWASMTDVLVCALLFDVNIDLYKSCDDLYCLEKITSQYNWKDTVCLYYNGINHFEALLQKM